MRRGYAPTFLRSKGDQASASQKKNKDGKKKERKKESKIVRKSKKKRRTKGDKDAGMRPEVMRQAEKAHWLQTDPGLENWICAGYAPGIKIWREERDEVARF